VHLRTVAQRREIMPAYSVHADCVCAGCAARRLLRLRAAAVSGLHRHRPVFLLLAHFFSLRDIRRRTNMDVRGTLPRVVGIGIDDQIKRITRLVPWLFVHVALPVTSRGYRAGTPRTVAGCGCYGIRYVYLCRLPHTALPPFILPVIRCWATPLPDFLHRPVGAHACLSCRRYAVVIIAARVHMPFRALHRLPPFWLAALPLLYRAFVDDLSYRLSSAGFRLCLLVCGL
jgi:hypothetical protein